jgi:hypothetical protein
VKRAPGEQQFSKQQETQGEGSQKKQTRRAGKAKQAVKVAATEKEASQGQDDEEQAQFACPVTLPSFFAPPHPLYERIAPPPVRVAPLPPSNSFFPGFSRALTLTNRIGIPATVETLKRLEMAEKAKDPHPLKRARTPPKEDEEISLDWSGNELDDELVALVSGPGKSRYAALNSILSKTLTKAGSVLKLHKNSLVLDFNNKSNLFAAPLGNVKSETPAEWLLDSGASMHFTNNICHEHRLYSPKFVKSVMRFVT